MEINIKQNQILKNKKTIKYQNEGIFLIFNKLTTEYNLYINGLKAEKEEENFEEKLSLLNSELSESTFNKILIHSNIEDDNGKIKSIIQDYYLFFITRNESLKRELNDLQKLCNILEMICNFQFVFNFKKNLTRKDLLYLIMWTNNFYSELNEFLFCIEYFHLGKYFEKKNIFKEILKKKDDNINIIEDDIIEELIGIKKGIEIILGVFNDLCLEFKDISIAKNIIEIIPTMHHINEKYKLECKELYFLFQIKYALKFTNLIDKNDKNIFSKFLRGLSKYRYSYKENITDYNDI